ncbi:MAG: cytochrome c3 family protein [bacterium]
MTKTVWSFTILGVALLAWLVFSQEKPLRHQDIIKFSHKYHQTEVETSCVDCHTKADSSSLASDNLLPTKEDCANCHDVEDEENCTKCHFKDKETWLPFENPGRDLNFSHQFHLTKAGASCETCHKNLNEVDFADRNSLPAMQDCAACHNQQQAALECVTCHRSTLNLRPADHTADYLVAHKNVARMDQEACATCHTDNDCAECHEGASLLATTTGSNRDVQTPFLMSPSGTKGLVLQRVHDLNFRFTHPLQAEGRSQECTVCHEGSNFCQTCHEAEGVDVAGKPVWHGGPDWGALAGVVGTGGGRHAELAKRDIETCAACHNTQGDDPTCLLCHTDFDGVQGTNPKTHDSGFANRFGGGASFHDDENALCFSCHTNTHQAGIGFCNYCHGAEVN